MKKITFITLVLALFAAGTVTAQSADKVTRMIGSEQVTLGQFSYFSASALGLVDDSATDEQAFQALKDNGYVKTKGSCDSPISLSQAAFICVKVWNIRGSLLLKLFPSPRYAFRQLQAEGIISTSADPSRKINGHEALNLLTSCMDAYGENTLAVAAGQESEVHDAVEQEAVTQPESGDDDASSLKDFNQE